MRSIRCCLASPIQYLVLCAALLVATSGLSVPARQEWVDTRQFGPYLVYSSFPLDEYQALFAELPELQRELTRTLGLPAARDPIAIHLFNDEASHRAYLSRQYPRVPYRRALFVKEGGRAGVYAYRHAELDVDIRHESTHALLHAVLPIVPLWLDEGLAEYFEVPPSKRAFDHPHFDSLRWRMRLGMVQSVEALELRVELEQMDGFDYQYSWAWIHFMLHGPEPVHRALVEYLAGIQQGNPGAPLSQRLATVMPNPTERMVQHFKRWHQ